MNIPLNIDWQQILLHLFNFAILAGGLYLLLYKPVKKFMKQREDYYINLDETAKSKLQQAESLKTDYQNRFRNVESEIAESRKKSLAAVDKIRTQKLLEAEENAEKVISEAKQEAERERTRILEQTQKEIADMVTTATEKLLLQTTASEAFDQFLAVAERSEQHE